MRKLFRIVGKEFIDWIKNLALVASLITIDALIYDGKGFIFSQQSADWFFWTFFWFSIALAVLATFVFIENVSAAVLDSPYERHAIRLSALMIGPCLSAVLLLVMVTARTYEFLHKHTSVQVQEQVAPSK